MPTLTFRRRLAVLALGALLLAPLAASAGDHRAHPEIGRAGYLAKVVDGWLGLLWGTLTSVWGESGCSLDPSGVTRCGQEGTSGALAGDNGCTIDPNGVRSCQPEASLTSQAADSGCSLDPNGRCAPVQ